MVPEALPTDPVPACSSCGGLMNEEAGVAVCPQCTVGSLLAMDPLTGADAPPAPSPITEVFDDVVPGVDLVMIKGSGGMGTVLKGRQLSLDRDVAVKIIRRDRADDPAYEAALREEASSMARLDHPGIVRVLDFGRTLGGSLYLLLEWVEGTTLRQLLDRRGALPAEEAASLILPLCAALQHAHDRCVVHRDLKPENILLTTEGQPKLADFGLARLGGRSASFAATGAKPNRTPSTVGTPAYMAPEQAGGAAVVDRRADLYALALILHEMLNGHRPAGRRTTGRSSENAPVLESLRQLPPSTPPALRALLARNLSSEVEHRAQTAHAFADDLRQAVSPPQAAASRDPGTGPTVLAGLSRRSWMVSLGALGVGAALGAAWRQRMSAAPASSPLSTTESDDPLEALELRHQLASMQRKLVERRSPAVDLLPSLSLSPHVPLRPPLSETAAAEMDRPLETGLDPDAVALRVARFASNHIRCYDSDSPRAPEVADDARIEIGSDESGFLNIGRSAAGPFRDKWKAYVHTYPHMYTMLLGTPKVRELEPGRYEALAILWSRFGSVHRFGKLETSLRLEISALENARLMVTGIRKSDSTIVPPSDAEARLCIYKMAKLVLENLTADNSALLPAFFEPKHFYRGQPRSREEVTRLVEEKSPVLDRNRIRLSTGPEVFRHDTWLHSGVFLADALKELPEYGIRAGQSCLVLLCMHFEKVWPLIRSLTVQPLGPGSTER